MNQSNCFGSNRN